MRILLRADAGEARGTGHIMRCLTLGEALAARGHSVELVGHVSGAPWLDAHLSALAIPMHEVPVDTFDPELVLRLRPDRVVVDSYWIRPESISAVNEIAPVLAIVDHDSRGIEATWYLDHNLGAENRTWPTDVRRRLLAGSRFALVRSAITAQRRPEGWRLPARPSVVAFMGGTDPLRLMNGVASSVARALPEIEFTAITTADQVADVTDTIRTMPYARVLPPTGDLPALLGSADLIVSAAGTSAWDVLTMGRPTVLVGVVDNQSESLALALEHGLALGFDATRNDVSGVGPELSRLLADESLRRRLVSAASAVFDGEGPERVSTRIEQHPPT